MFVFFVDHDMNGLSLVRAEGFLSTPGSGDTTVQVRNKSNIDPHDARARPTLTSASTSRSMEESSYFLATQPSPAIPTRSTRVCYTAT